MDAAQVADLCARRGQVIAWYRSHPATTTDPLYGAPNLSVSPPRTPLGPTGESYDSPVSIIAYCSGRVNHVAWRSFGPLDAGDMALWIAVPFTPYPDLGVTTIDAAHTTAYNAGQFVTLQDGAPLARDQFLILNEFFAVKSHPTPIVDANVVIAYRLLVGKAMFSG